MELLVHVEFRIKAHKNVFFLTFVRIYKTYKYAFNDEYIYPLPPMCVCLGRFHWRKASTDIVLHFSGSTNHWILFNTRPFFSLFFFSFFLIHSLYASISCIISDDNVSLTKPHTQFVLKTFWSAAYPLWHVLRDKILAD